MMSLLYATNMNAATSVPPAVASTSGVNGGAGTSRSRLDDEINQTSFKVRKYIESKISILDPTMVITTGSKPGTNGNSNRGDKKSEMGKIILDARKRVMYARRLQRLQQEQKEQQQGSAGCNDVATEARRLGDVVAKMRETTTAEYCALKERAAALEKQKMALDAELNLCLQSLQVVGQAGSSVIDCDEWYASTITPALDGTAPETTTATTPSTTVSVSNTILQSRNDEDVSARSSYPAVGSSTNSINIASHHNPFIETILRKEEEKRTLRCAEVMASLATKQHSKLHPNGHHHIEGQWTEAEDAMIIKAVTESTAKPFTSWTALSEFLPGRTGKQIRERWFNSLDPNINKSPFTSEDDDLLWESHHKFGKKWVEIAAKAFHGFRSANQVKNRWHSAKFKEIVLTKYGEGAYQRANAKGPVRTNGSGDGGGSSSSSSSGSNTHAGAIAKVSPSLDSSSSSNLSFLSRKRDLVDDDSMSTPELKKVRQ